jgi:hypothetical protein
MLFFTILGTVSFAGIALSQTFTNPIRNPGADPHLVTHDGWYYLTNTQAEFISVTRATTIGGLYEGETRTVYQETDPSRNQNVWAPEMHLIDGTLVISPSLCPPLSCSLLIYFLQLVHPLLCRRRRYSQRPTIIHY